MKVCVTVKNSVHLMAYDFREVKKFANMVYYSRDYWTDTYRVEFYSRSSVHHLSKKQVKKILEAFSSYPVEKVEVIEPNIVKL